MENTEETKKVERRDVDMFIMQKGKFFPEMQIKTLREQLLSLDYNQFILITSVEYKEPMTMLLISIFLGYLGVDRFILSQTGIGIGKLLTTLICGIGLVWWLIDLFKIGSDTKDFNYQKCQQMIAVNQ